jgi:hypothetical protein
MMDAEQYGAEWPSRGGFPPVHASLLGGEKLKKVTTILLSAACILGLASLGFAQDTPTINEILMNDVSTDDVEFFEICWTPNTDLSAFTFVQIEGDANSSSRGRVLSATNLTGFTDANGLYTVGDPNVTCAQQSMSTGTLQNGGGTFVLCRDFTGDTTTDIDTDNDGIQDAPFPSGPIVDLIATGRPSQGDVPYLGAVMLGPDTGPEGTSDFDPAGLARCRDCDGEWGMICLDGSEGDPVCLDANPDNNYNVSNASPCQPNACAPISVDASSGSPDFSWSRARGRRRTSPGRSSPCRISRSPYLPAPAASARTAAGSPLSDPLPGESSRIYEGGIPCDPGCSSCCPPRSSPPPHVVRRSSF